MGVHGFSIEDGLSTPNMMEVEVNRLFLERSNSRILLADHSKWGTKGLYRIAELDAIDTLITDDALLPADVEALAEHIQDLRLEKA